MYLSYPYVIFVGKISGDLQPVKTAPTEKEAVSIAKGYEKTYPYVEAIYMPENYLDVNRIVYAKCKEEE